MTMPHAIDPNEFLGPDPLEADAYQPEPEPTAEPGPRDWYTGAEVAALLAPAVGLGVKDNDTARAIQEDYIERAAARLELFGVGRALAAYGYHKGDGARDVDIPPGVALTVCAFALAGTALEVRGHHNEPIRVPAGVRNAAARAGWRALLARLDPRSWFGRGRHDARAARPAGAAAGEPGR